MKDYATLVIFLPLIASITLAAIAMGTIHYKKYRKLHHHV